MKKHSNNLQIQKEKSRNKKYIIWNLWDTTDPSQHSNDENKVAFHEQ